MAKYQLLISNLTPLIIFTLILTFAGLVIFSRLYQTKNKLLTLGASMILGPLGFLLVLNLGSYFLKGQVAVFLIFFLYIVFSLTLFFQGSRIKNSFRNLFLLRYNFSNFLTVAFVLFYLILIALFTHRTFIGSDSDIYFSIATSFAKGNYPAVLPYQPHFLTVYHMGAFILEGALWALSNRDIELIHYFFSLYEVGALFILITGIAREKLRSIWSLIPAILTTFLIGGPVFISKIGNLNSLFTNLAQKPDFLFFQSSNGAGAADLGGLIYSNFYTFGLGVFLIFLLFLTKQSLQKFNLWRYLLLSVILILNTSIDESFFPIGLILLFGLFLWQIKISTWGVECYCHLGNFAALTFVLVSFFFLIQNPVRDSILTPSPEISRFKLLLQLKEQINWNGLNKTSVRDELEKRLKYTSGKSTEENRNTWSLLDIRILMVLLLIGLILKPNRFRFFLLASSFLTYILSFFVINTFWPPNALRLSNQAYQLSFLAFGLILVNFISEKKFPRVMAIIILVLLLPQIFVTHAKIINTAFSKDRGNFSQTEKDNDLKQIVKYIPNRSVAIFLDRYPNPAPHSYLNYTALTKMGIFVPIAPPQIKILNPAPGIEWLDAVNTLSQYALKVLNVEYAYIQDAALARLSVSYISMLKDKRYFEEVKRFGSDGVLYKIKPDFFLTEDNNPSLKKISLTIGSGKKVYLDKLSMNEVRKALLLELAKKNHVIGPPFAHGGDFYMYIETILPFDNTNIESLDDINYILLDKGKLPEKKIGEFTKIIESNYVSLWKNIR